MDTRHLVESPLAVALPTATRPAPADPLGTPVPATLGTRRDFCLAACQALSLGAIAATLQACGGGGNPNEPSGGNNVPALPSLNATVTNGAATLSVDGTALASAGGAALVTSGLGTMLVVRNDATTISAFTATCTHQQCTVNGFTEGVFQCPCHGSRYNASSGSVVRGPATQPLRKFTATLANGVVSITV
jgi:nitrite reductase/ring-hydroxylating ferredoxin subunit